ncbi:hypothetical protein DXG03_002994 [Asterophora parasitica]|uniref:Glyoxalase-like domain-containing protein n=1 Tax=Asterophora parasitica TaxID=117018 RepID=A0A9P7G3T9_9AGAR|nr:hypothetical protein DXG03_002994 [Asterophora parasitica]
MSSTNTKTLDHIVHLTPPGSVEATSEQFRNLGFNVVPGGTHADGLTANALVASDLHSIQAGPFITLRCPFSLVQILADGVYLELISFTHPSSYYPPGSAERKARDSHTWASKAPGWIDFAFLGNGSLTTRISDVINERAKRDGSGAVYSSESAGGRRRPDGKVLKWVISAPSLVGSAPRGTLPFFCGDVTPRDWRVPTEPPSNTEHPSTTQGIAYIVILAPTQELQSISRQLTSVIGNPPVASTETEITWHLDALHAKHGPSLVLRSPSDRSETAFVREEGVGIFEVAFAVKDSRREGSDDTPYGKVIWVPA